VETSTTLERHRRTLEHEVTLPLGLTSAYDPTSPLRTRGKNPLDLVFWKGDDVDVSPMQTSPGSPSDHLTVTCDVTGTTLESLVAPHALPELVRWDRLPSTPFNLLPEDQHAQFADFVDDCTAVLTDACQAEDPPSHSRDRLPPCLVLLLRSTLEPKRTDARSDYPARTERCHRDCSWLLHRSQRASNRRL